MNLEAATILWVRHCPACRRIDRRQWFEAEDLAADGSWSCPACGETDFRLLRTKW
jgi:hypothetical protein